MEPKVQYLFKRSPHFFSSRGRLIQSTPLSYFFKTRFNIIFPSARKYSKYSASSDFPIKTLYAFSSPKQNGKTLLTRVTDFCYLNCATGTLTLIWTFSLLYFINFNCDIVIVTSFFRNEIF